MFIHSPCVKIIFQICIIAGQNMTQLQRQQLVICSIVVCLFWLILDYFTAAATTTTGFAQPTIAQFKFFGPGQFVHERDGAKSPTRFVQVLYCLFCIFDVCFSCGWFGKFIAERHKQQCLQWIGPCRQ